MIIWNRITKEMLIIVEIKIILKHMGNIHCLNSILIQIINLQS